MKKIFPLALSIAMLQGCMPSDPNVDTNVDTKPESSRATSSSISDSVSSQAHSSTNTSSANTLSSSLTSLSSSSQTSSSINISSTVSSSTVSTLKPSDCNTSLGANPFMIWDFDSNVVTSTDFQLVDGVCGNGAKVTPDSTLDFNYALSSNMATGAVEFDVKPASNWDSTASYMLFGNDGARLLLVYSNGVISFLKNQSDIHINTSVKIQLSSIHWSHIAAQWGPSGLWINVDGVQNGNTTETSVYQPSPRTAAENELKIGGKTYCCMEGVGLYNALGANASYDNIRLYSHEIIRIKPACPVTDSSISAL